MSLISQKRRKRQRQPTKPHLPSFGVHTHSSPELGALSIVRKQPNLQHIDLTRRGPNPTVDNDDRPEEYERYRGKVSARVLMHLAAAVPEMKSVSLKGCQRLDRTVLRSLSTGPCSDNITGLDLSDSSLNDDSIQVLAHFDSIKDLDLSRTNIKDGALQWVVEGCFRTLQQLALGHCQKITDVGVEWIAGMCGFSPKPCRHIMMLDFGHCKRIGDRALRALGSGCPKIQSINLEYCIRVSDHGIDALTEGCRDIRVLVLRRLGKLSNHSLKYIGTRCPNLRSLCVDYCVHFGDVGVEKVGSGCPKLECASFAGCLRVSERSVCSIAAGCPNMMALNVTGCQGVTENGLINLCRGNGKIKLMIHLLYLKHLCILSLLFH